LPEPRVDAGFTEISSSRGAVFFSAPAKNPIRGFPLGACLQKPMLKGLAVSLTDGGTSLPLQDAAISDPQKPRLFDGVA
jgi:hypothetical protein